MSLTWQSSSRVPWA